MSIRIWDVPYAYGTKYSYGAEQSDQEAILIFTAKSSNLEVLEIVDQAVIEE